MYFICSTNFTMLFEPHWILFDCFIFTIWTRLTIFFNHAHIYLCLFVYCKQNVFSQIQSCVQTFDWSCSFHFLYWGKHMLIQHNFQLINATDLICGKKHYGLKGSQWMIEDHDIMYEENPHLQNAEPIKT